MELNFLNSYSNILPQSFGKYLYSQIKEKDENKICMIDLKSNKEISYGELLNLSVKLATNLKNILGLKKDDVIAIISENNWKYIVTLISAFYVGAKINLLNHDYSAGEIAHAFSICPPNYIFCTTKSLDTILQVKEKFNNITNIILLDENNINSHILHIDKLLFNNNDSATNTYEFEPENFDPKQKVGLILLSSGTTGLPKGVMITHENLIISISSCHDSKYVDINENETTLSYLPFFHIFGVIINLSSVSFGCQLIIIEKFSPDVFLDAIEKYEITKLFTVPQILKFLAFNPLVDNYNLTKIKDIICGAAPVGKDVEEAVEKRFKVNSIRQLYGLTECSSYVTCIPSGIKKHGSIGKPIANFFHLKIRDINTHKTLGPNQLGEICVKSRAVMKGYLGNIEETQASFDCDGFLKTGDLGFYDEDGYYFIVDRIKEIIKYKGFQIAPTELENILIKHSSVKDAAVTGKPDERSGEVPIAFIVKQNNVELIDQEIIDFVAGHVSLHKRLHEVIFVDAIPRNASGKILRRQLKEVITKKCHL